jgi:addiction module HigA family antidote
MSKSPIITDDLWSADPADWLHNPHAGEMLQSEFLEPLGWDAATLAGHLNMDAAHVEDIVAGRARMDAETDLRLSRYFRMNPGFFLGLQLDYELLEAKRALNGELDRIVPRAA